jgi:hypothetical protein
MGDSLFHPLVLIVMGYGDTDGWPAQAPRYFGAWQPYLAAGFGFE